MKTPTVILLMFLGIAICGGLIKFANFPDWVRAATALVGLAWVGFIVPSIAVKFTNYRHDGDISVFSIAKSLLGHWTIGLIAIAVPAIWLGIFLEGGWLGLALLVGTLLILVRLIDGGEFKLKQEELSRSEETAKEQAITQQQTNVPVKPERLPEFENNIASFREGLSHFQRRVFDRSKSFYGFDLDTFYFPIQPDDFENHWAGAVFNEVMGHYEPPNFDVTSSEHSAAVGTASRYLIYRICLLHPDKAALKISATVSLKRIADSMRGKNKERIERLLGEYESIDDI